MVDLLLPSQPGKPERLQHRPAYTLAVDTEVIAGLLRNGAFQTVSRQMLEILVVTICRIGKMPRMRWYKLDFESHI